MADKEYIEREAVLEEFDACKPRYWRDTEAEVQANWDYKLYRSIVAEAPTADVVEVRRGRWLPQRLLGADVVDCSECKTLGSPQWNWCPVCGADMRESGKAEEDKEVKIGEMFSEMKLVIHEGNGMMFTEVDGKIESLPKSTVGIKLTYRGEQYGVVRTFEKPKLDTVDIVTAVNSMFEDLKDAEAFRL